jgi:hypothetical protein
MLTEWVGMWGKQPTLPRAIMRLFGMGVLAAAFGVAVLLAAPGASLAQSSDPKSEKQPAGDGKDGQKKIDEFAEAEQLLTGPAASRECVWLGRRVVSLLWRDDLDTAFRHLDLYDRFGCPADHIQATFRCVLKHGDIDSKAAEKLTGRVHACWINPTGEVRGTAAAPSTSTNR